jgi:putative addiction module component (TIGR02574 family)
MSAAELLEKAKALPIEERAELVNQLQENLAEEGYDFDPEPTPAQVAELERRAEELRRHPERGIPLETVRSELKERREKNGACRGK